MTFRSPLPKIEVSTGTGAQTKRTAPGAALSEPFDVSGAQKLLVAIDAVQQALDTYVPTLGTSGTASSAGAVILDRLARVVVFIRYGVVIDGVFEQLSTQSLLLNGVAASSLAGTVGNVAPPYTGAKYKIESTPTAPYAQLFMNLYTPAKDLACDISLVPVPAATTITPNTASAACYPVGPPLVIKRDPRLDAGGATVIPQPAEDVGGNFAGWRATILGWQPGEGHAAITPYVGNTLALGSTTSQSGGITTWTPSNSPTQQRMTSAALAWPQNRDVRLERF